eukprot:scaffold763_cov402-Prasinococcus_capsulatus_cf.AAC.15
MSTIAPETASAAGRSVASDHSSASKGDQASTPTNFRMKAQEAEEYVFDVVGKLKENKFVYVGGRPVDPSPPLEPGLLHPMRMSPAGMRPLVV